jgi:2-oxoglutarate ferredoxin oxidoreductase subunit alpha
VILVSDLLLSEHPETIEPDALNPNVPIDRGKLLAEVPTGYRRYAMTSDGISPRVLPGTPGASFVAASDEHDEDGNVISDQFTNAPLRRKMHEKRMRKMDGVLPKLTPPQLEGPAEADVTLVGWGSSWGAIHEALALLKSRGIRANHLQIKYIVPFHVEQVSEILSSSRRIIVVENNISGQFAHYLRSQTGIQADDLVLKYDGEPMTPEYIARHVEGLVRGTPETRAVTEDDAREIAYHFIRIELADEGRPIRLEKNGHATYDEPVWEVTIADRSEGEELGTLLIGVETGSTHLWQPQS